MPETFCMKRISSNSFYHKASDFAAAYQVRIFFDTLGKRALRLIFLLWRPCLGSRIVFFGTKNGAVLALQCCSRILQKRMNRGLTCISDSFF